MFRVKDLPYLKFHIEINLYSFYLFDWLLRNQSPLFKCLDWCAGLCWFSRPGSAIGFSRRKATRWTPFCFMGNSHFKLELLLCYFSSFWKRQVFAGVGRPFWLFSSFYSKIFCRCISGLLSLNFGNQEILRNSKTRFWRIARRILMPRLCRRLWC